MAMYVPGERGQEGKEGKKGKGKGKMEGNREGHGKDGVLNSFSSQQVYSDIVTDATILCPNLYLAARMQLASRYV